KVSFFFFFFAFVFSFVLILLSSYEAERNGIPTKKKNETLVKKYFVKKTTNSKLTPKSKKAASVRSWVSFSFFFTFVFFLLSLSFFSLFLSIKKEIKIIYFKTNKTNA